MLARKTFVSRMPDIRACHKYSIANVARHDHGALGTVVFYEYNVTLTHTFIIEWQHKHAGFKTKHNITIKTQ